MSKTLINSAPFPPIRACIFDVDGLLVNSEDIYTEIFNHILHSYNKPSLPWRIKAKQQSRGREGTQLIVDWAQLPITVEEWKTLCVKEHERFRECRPLPGVTELLDTLSNRTVPAVRLAIASSATSKSFELKTGHLSSITSPFPKENRIFGDNPSMSDARKKPAPNVFLLALEALNVNLGLEEIEVKPEECLVFEDSVAGIEAGRRAGMRVCWVPHHGLREIYQGNEEKVLTGRSNEVDIDTLSDEGKKDKKVNEAGHIWSKDGWAEMRTTLEGFDYGHYGIEKKRD